MKNICTFVLFTFLFSSYQVNAQIVPDFTVTTITGETFNLYDKLDEGKYVLLDFYFVTCGPCIEMVPAINTIFETYGCNNSDEIYFMSIDFGDTDAQVIQFKEDYSSLLPSASGLQGGGDEVVEAYNVLYAPYLILISPDKEIVDSNISGTIEDMTASFDNESISADPSACNIVSSTTEIFTENLKVYPNPASQELTLTWADTEIESVEIHSIFGRKIEAIGVKGAEGKANIHINNLPTGSYILTTHTAEGVNGKVLFQKAK